MSGTRSVQKTKLQIVGMSALNNSISPSELSVYRTGSRLHTDITKNKNNLIDNDADADDEREDISNEDSSDTCASELGDRRHQK